MLLNQGTLVFPRGLVPGADPLATKL